MRSDGCLINMPLNTKKDEGGFMIYPKEIMSTRELLNMGFPKPWLVWVSNRHNQKVCWQSSPKPNSKIFWDTEELEKVRIADCRAGRGIDV